MSYSRLKDVVVVTECSKITRWKEKTHAVHLKIIAFSLYLSFYRAEFELFNHNLLFMSVISTPGYAAILNSLLRLRVTIKLIGPILSSNIWKIHCTFSNFIAYSKNKALGFLDGSQVSALDPSEVFDKIKHFIISIVIYI